MTLTAPKHLRGRIGNHNRALLDERAAWIRQAHGEGYTAVAIGKALGLSDGAAFKACAQAGCTRVSQQSMCALRKQGLKFGSPGKAYHSMSIPARARLADASARRGKPLLQVLTDFWNEHHGADA